MMSLTPSHARRRHIQVTQDVTHTIICTHDIIIFYLRLCSSYERMYADRLVQFWQCGFSQLAMRFFNILLRKYSLSNMKYVLLIFKELGNHRDFVFAYVLRCHISLVLSAPILLLRLVVASTFKIPRYWKLILESLLILKLYCFKLPDGKFISM